MLTNYLMLFTPNLEMLPRDIIVKLKFLSPVVFTSGDKVIQKYLIEYKVHKKGLFILAPSGSGKTYFVKHQEEKNWIDGDELWNAAGAHPEGAWWTQGLEMIEWVDQRSDVITAEAIKLGLWIIGASNYWLIPNAVVIPDWETHKKYIIEREKNNYDGGATSDMFDQVQNHRKWMEERAQKFDIPVYKSIKEATEFLSRKVG